MSTLIDKIKNGEYSTHSYSISEWEKIVSPFKDSNSSQKLEYGSQSHGYIWNELIPLVTLAKAIGPNCKLKFLGPKQNNTDGILYDSSLPKEGQGVQCVAAIDGHMESLKIEHFKKFGELDGFADIEYSGTKKNRKIIKNKNTGMQWAEDPKLLQEFETLIENAIKKKIDEKYSGLWLLIVIGGFKSYRLDWEESREIAQKVFDSIVKKMGKELSSIYKRIILIDNSFESKPLIHQLN